MSKTLNRPMFRGGGRVESRGTGIVANLEYRVPKAMGGMMSPMRMGYEMGGDVPKSGSEILQQTGAFKPIDTSMIDLTSPGFKETFKEEEKKQKALGDLPSSQESFLEGVNREYNKKVQDLESSLQMYQGPEDYFTMEQKAKELNFLKSAKGKQSLLNERIKDYEKKLKRAKDLNIDKKLLPASFEETQKSEQQATQIESDLSKADTRSEFKRIFEDYLPIFREQLAEDKDEYTRQRFLELAKFGTNLLAQGGGDEKLLTKIGRAGTPAIEGLSRIQAEESKAEKLPRALALEAALKSIGEGRMTATEKSIIAKTIGDYATSISQDTGIGNVASTQIAEEIVGAGKQLKDFQSHPGDALTGNEIKGQYYYFEKTGPGQPRVGRWNGKEFISPGEKGFK
jgi:hypothetical protein